MQPAIASEQHPFGRDRHMTRCNSNDLLACSFHLDDCWAGGRNASGYLYPELDHFPNGMKPVIDYVHSKNLSFGLYTCAGTYTCVGNRPGSRDHWDKDAAVWAEWGVDWVKM